MLVNIREKNKFNVFFIFKTWFLAYFKKLILLKHQYFLSFNSNFVVYYFIKMFITALQRIDVLYALQVEDVNLALP